MGNKLGGSKSSKPKEEKKREKEPATKREKEEEKTKKKATKKEKKESKSKKKEKAKKPDGKSKFPSGRVGDRNSGSEFDSDPESSHVTGWDSESGVFHSAENLSTSPYLDSHTRSELEHSGTWSALYESSASRHPQVLSSRDFRDGFSLEACIPPEIARRETNYYDQDGGSGGGTSSNVFSYSNSSSLKSKRSNSSKSSRMTPTSARHHADDLMSVSTSSSQRSGPTGREGYSTPLLTTPVFGRVDRSHSPTAPGCVSSTLARVHEADCDAMDIVSLSKSPFDPNAKVYTSYNPPSHLAHLYQHPSQTIDYRNLPKPTSPHPQRRALSPKMTSSPFKLISSDDSSSSPSTPIPQRKATNIIADLLRSGRSSSDKKPQKSKAANTSESDENSTFKHRYKTDLATAEERKKSKGLSMWKTWERSSKKKSDKTSKINIFGTARKTNKKNEKKEMREEDKMSREDRTADRMSDSTLKDVSIAPVVDNFPDKTDRSTDKFKQSPFKITKSSTSSYENSSSRGASDVDYWTDKNRNSSPPVAKSAASCIMRLEELERNIEKTIREKFPDAEPFLIRKRTPPDDSSRGSKSLPTTPSPKKKLFISHDNGDSLQKEVVTSTLKAASNKLGAVAGATRYYDETFEESASPAMSPVVLRRFGARTRHASISPKIQRAKTAALYNSPSEMERVAECDTPITLDTLPDESTNQHPTLATHSKITASGNSFHGQGHHLVRQRRIELSESEDDSMQSSHTQLKNRDAQGSKSDKIETINNKSGVDTHSFDKPVIVPSFSAVFGSVSPKLKRHLQGKLDGQHVNGKARSFGQPDGRVHRHLDKGASVDSGLKIYRGELKSGQQSKSFATTTSGPSMTSSPSVQSRVANIIKTMSEGWAGSGEGGGGYPSPSHAHASDKRRFGSTGTTTATSLSPTTHTPVWPNSGSHLRSADTKLHSEAEAGMRESPMTSPGTGRKHSTDHVIFGSAVALPCRLYSNSSSPPSSPERRMGTNNNNKYSTSSHFDSSPQAHAQSGATGVHERNVKRCEGQVDVTANTPTLTQSKHVEESGKERTKLPDRQVDNNSTRGGARDTVPLSLDNSCDRKSKNRNTSSNRNDRDAKSVKQSDVIPDSVSGGDFHKSSSPRPLREGSRSGHGDVRKGVTATGSKVGRQPVEKVLEEEQPVIVLKQPVSKVISDMINSSKQKQQEQQQHHQQQQHKKQQQQQQEQRHWQASPTTPEKDAMHVEPAVAMVATPSFQQVCLALGEERVVNGSTRAPPSQSHVTSVGAYGTHKQAEEFPIHHAAVKSETSERAKRKDTNEPSVAQSTSNESSESSDLDRFLKSVKSSETVSPHAKVKSGASCQSSAENNEQNPPPPSPTATEKVSEILEEEEGEEEEVEEALTQPRKEVNLALVRQNQIRAFSDEVCQRLSDLLSSHTGSDEVFAGTDWKEEDDEKEVEEDEIFKENIETVKESSKFKDDLQEHWEDPGLLSELSEDHTIETLTITKSTNDPSPAMDLRPSRFSTSSSLSTSTSSSSSSSGLFAPPSLPPSGKRNAESQSKRKIDQEYFAYHKQEDDDEYFDDQYGSRQEVFSRNYHSDDDVARGGGIPDYYDDRPLWKRRQKPPGQMSIALAATRRRERRERWLKKRRRNRTEIVSTGSSEMGSQTSLKQSSRRSFGDSTGSCEYEDDEEVVYALSSHQRAMGSGILSSPKYSKPIVPFWGSGDIVKKSPLVAKEELMTQEKLAPRLAAPPSHHGGYDDDGEDKDSSTLSRSTDHTVCDEHSRSFDTMDELDDARSSLSLTTTSTDLTATADTSSTTGSHSHIAIPGLEETFDELMSVKQILEELQDRTPTAGAGVSKGGLSHQALDNSNNNKQGGKCMPLTVENIKSIKEFYKDSGGNGRRSRMSNTDRTESDLDLFSEYRDDASTDSNLYADDEEDDDNNDPYKTADDDVEGATGGDDDEHFVVSCTFYNSNSAPPELVHTGNGRGNGESNMLFATGGISGTDSDLPVLPMVLNDNNRNNVGDNNRNLLPLPRSAGASYVRSNSAPGSRSGNGNQFSMVQDASAAAFNSDEEFWAGRAAFEKSYQQLESAAGAVSSTFQNAREQMMDIQQHLQALRRQMEGLQDDLASTSYTLTPDYSAFDSK